MHSNIDLVQSKPDWTFLTVRVHSRTHICTLDWGCWKINTTLCQHVGERGQLIEHVQQLVENVGNK